MTYILQMNHIEAHELQKMGGKARALALLGQAGMVIPEWFVVTPDAFIASVPKSLMEELKIAVLQSEEAVTRVLRDITLDSNVEAMLKKEVELLSANGELLAVRSSALDEDGAEHSFAGQLESYLFVKPEDVSAKVLQVWRSGFSQRILTYRKEKGLSLLPEPPAVLVQRMVDSETAGVAFSADSLTGQRKIAIVGALYGLGTAIVSGECDADTYKVNRSGEIVEREIATKLIAHRFSMECDEGVESVDVAKEKVNQPALTDELVRSVAELAHRCERYFGRPQDIEWAIQDGRLYLLQSRPITNLADMIDPDDEFNLWDNSNISESYGGITTPLTFSFARHAYAEVYKSFCRIMGVSGEEIVNRESVFRCMIGLVNGRVYYNLLNWYRCLALLPGYQMNRNFMEQMMGVKEALPQQLTDNVQQQVSMQDKLKDAMRLGKTIVKLIGNFRRLPKTIDVFYQRLNNAVGITRPDLHQYSTVELANYYLKLQGQLLTRWDAPLINDFGAMIYYGLLRKLTTKWCNDEDSTLQNSLLAAEGGIISAEPAIRMKKLMKVTNQDAKFIDILCKGSLAEIMKEMDRFPEFKEEYEAYLDKFGDRCLDELKLESINLFDNPLPLLRSIGYLAVRSSPTEMGPSEEEIRRIAEEQAFKSIGFNLFRRVLFRWVLKNARLRVRDRENLRFERTRVFGRCRSIFLEMGRRFYALDLLDDPRDVFYLEVGELLGMADGTATCSNLKGLVALRKAEFEKYHEMDVPEDRFETYGVIYKGNTFKAKAPKEPLTGDVMKGIGCAAGVVRGPVRVVTDPREVTLLPGEILVAERTDPGWIVLFSSAAGLLVERGSLLSHVSIVCREIGIPGIVSVTGLTRWLKTGDWVEFDGSTGVIRKITPEEGSISA
ncbi:PEP/pyruvate-binding domain-containing protein [Brevibacillus laterosporus]|uniref:PEP/pyruvate-binding domain-containing protein n=1 Tax=Brevibacillus laterosporus TaxID=1465 RepID=UPI000B9B8F2A|nr:PEP/pyruvate-binding domain-containing protein [Brevibacillus laterosporus]